MSEELVLWRELFGRINPESGKWEKMWQAEIAELVGVVGASWSRGETGSPVQNPLQLRRALRDAAHERGIELPDYLRKQGRARLLILKRAAESVQQAAMAAN